MEEIIYSVEIAPEREKYFTILYKKAFPAVAKYVKRMGGSFEEAKDIFQDSLVIYYEKDQSGELQNCRNEKAYILGIAKYLWIKKHKENNQFQSLDDILNLSSGNITEEPAQSSKLIAFLEAAGQRCLDILTAFYYDNLQPIQIAERFGYSGVRSATVQKYKCLEKVRDKVKEKSLCYEDFIE